MLQEFFSQLKIYVTIPMCCSSKFSSYVTMISNFSIVIINKFFTNPATVTLLKEMFIFTPDKSFVKVFLHYFFSVPILLKNCFTRFISSIFTSKNKNQLSERTIYGNNFVSKTTRNVILIFFCVRTFIAFNFFLITLKISINFKWNV